MQFDRCRDFLAVSTRLVSQLLNSADSCSRKYELTRVLNYLISNNYLNKMVQISLVLVGVEELRHKMLTSSRKINLPKADVPHFIRSDEHHFSP